MNQLADCYKEDEVADYNQSLIWYKKLLVKGEDVFYHIGSFYERGEGVTKDYKEAFNWYNKGLENNLKTKQSEGSIGFNYYLIASLYCEGGFGIEQNYEEAIKLYKLAADRGLELAMEALSRMYKEGQGVEKDEKIAKEWSDKAEKARENNQ
jgi:TPR repeat protein